jgi:hypothetical protein
MKIVRIYTGDDNETNAEIIPSNTFELIERNNTRTKVEPATGIQYSYREAGHFGDFHNAPRRQYVMYLTAQVEIGLGDGSIQVLEPGDVLLAEDTTGRGHSSRVVKTGISATVRLE